MATYSGPCTITDPAAVIDSKVINCDTLLINATPTAGKTVVIKNSYIHGGVIQQGTNTAPFTIQDSFLDNSVLLPACVVVTIPNSGGQQSASCPAGKYACGDNNNQTNTCGVGYTNFNIYRTEIIGTNRAAYCQKTCTIQDNYFHGTTLQPDYTDRAHASSVRNEEYLTLDHNALGCDYAGPTNGTDLGCSADMSGYPDFAPITHDTINKNLFLANPVGLAYCAYGGISNKANSFYQDPSNATYIVFTNNVFQRGPKQANGNNGICGQYGPVTDFPVGYVNGAYKILCIGSAWSNNIWDDGSPVTLGDSANGLYVGAPPSPLYCTPAP
jgi:hypothetical protein